MLCHICRTWKSLNMPQYTWNKDTKHHYLYEKGKNVLIMMFTLSHLWPQWVLSSFSMSTHLCVHLSVHPFQMTLPDLHFEDCWYQPEIDGVQYPELDFRFLFNKFCLLCCWLAEGAVVLWMFWTWMSYMRCPFFLTTEHSPFQVSSKFSTSKSMNTGG